MSANDAASELSNSSRREIIADLRGR